MATRDTGKGRSLRIDLGYYKKPDRFLHGKRWLAGSAAALIVAWGAYAFMTRNDMPASRGPLAEAHAAWDNNCTACHVDFFSFSPMSQQNWTKTVGASHADTEQKCKACHQAPTHHEHLADEATCSACHHDHRGREATLTRLPDSDCTNCHAEKLYEHIDLPAGKPKRYHHSISRFDTDHPEFCITDARIPLNEAWVTKDKERKDPGRLKFNHKLHMTAGLESQFTYGKIDSSQQERYWNQQLDDHAGKTPVDKAIPVKLECKSCHELDSSSPVPAGLPAAVQRLRSPGAYVQPVVFETHCQACHPLTFERTDGDKPETGHLAIRHRLQPDEVHQYLEGFYAGRCLEGNPSMFERPAQSRRMPGKPPDAATEQALTLIKRNVDIAKRQLFVGKKTCAECHTYEDNARGIPHEILATAVPEVWFPHAMFDHAAHRAISCVACHERADANHAEASTSAADVLLPGIENCRQCHSPPSGSGNTARGGARHDCTGCHRYHNGDSALSGIGAWPRSARKPGSIQEFLNGRLPQ